MPVRIPLETRFTWPRAGTAARPAILHALFGASTRHTQSIPGANLVAETGTEPVLAAAVWAPPGRWKTPWWRSLSMAPQLLRSADRSTLQEFGRRGPALDRALNSAHPSQPHWYLASLAVSPAAQGTGAGSALVRSGLDRSRRQGLPTYLECTEDLMDYYARFGFHVVHAIRPGRGAPDQLGMWAE